MAEISGFDLAENDEDGELRMFHERKLSRDEAISRFFTPLPGREKIKPTAEILRKNGGTEDCFINPRSSFIAPQIRDAYDPAKIQILGANIRDRQNGQLQNCAVAFVDENNIERYIDDLNRYFESNISPKDLDWHSKFECYVITVFGHNRQLAIAWANLESGGHPDKGILMRANVYRNPSFWRMIEAQAAENSGDKPPPWDRSRAIVNYKQMRARDGLAVTQTEVAEIFAVDSDQIWRAERYESLPKEIRELVAEQRLVYSGAFELDVLIKSYGEEYVIDLAKDLADRELSAKQVMDAIKRRKSALVLTPEAQYLINEGVIRTADAAVLAEYASILSESDINNLVSWISLGGVSHKEVKAEVAKIVKIKMSGAVDMFNSEAAPDSEELAAVESRQAKLDEANIRAHVQGSLRGVAASMIGLQAVSATGMLSGAADELIPSTAPDQLLDSLSDWIERTDLSELSSDKMREQIKKILGHTNKSEQIWDAILNTLDEVAAEDAHTQAEKRARLDRISINSPTKQDSLFK